MSDKLGGAFRGLDLSGVFRSMERPSFQIPKMAPNIMLELAQANMASEFYKRLGQQIQVFDESLDQDHEVGMRLVTFGQAVTFHVEEIGYHNPSLILLHGTMDGGERVTLVQHVSQISFLLIAMRRQNPDEPKKPFGFCMPNKKEAHAENE